MNRTKLPNGAYLVFGPELAPQVHLLGPQEQATYWEAERIARNSTDPDRYLCDVYRMYFGSRDVRSIVPAWSRDAMQLIAMEYAGPWQTEVRGIAAAIALGRPWARDHKSDDKGEGGTKVTPSKPPKGPKGGDKVSPFASLTTSA